MISRLINLTLIIGLLISPALATVTVSSNYYNEDSSLSNDLTIDSGIYSDFTLLDQNDIFFTGGGKSTQPSSSFSQDIASVNGQNKDAVSSSVKTSSGSFGWSSTRSSDEAGNKVKMNTKYSVSDGNVQAHFSNDRFETGKDLTVTGGSYIGVADIFPDNLYSAGNGYTPIGNNLLDESIFIGDSDNWGWIDLYQDGTGIKSKWRDLVQASPDSQLYGMSMETAALDGEAVFGMTGDASGFPMQHLPAGNLEVVKTLDVKPGDGSGSSVTIDTEKYPEDWKTLVDYYLSTSAPTSGNNGETQVGSSDQFDPSPYYHSDHTWEDYWKPLVYPVEAKGTFNLLLKMAFQTPF